MILVIGDVMLDCFIRGSITRISPEAPVPVLKHDHLTICPGGAANVAENIRAMGSEVMLMSVTGSDQDVNVCRSIKTVFIRDPSRPTTMKTRVMAGNHPICRIDQEVDNPLSESIESSLIDCIRLHASPSLIVVSDYAKGVVTSEVFKVLRRRFNCPIIIDPKRRDFRFYDGADIITPNNDEWLRAKHVEVVPTHVITLGEHGMMVRHRGLKRNIPGIKVNAIDVTGAGDTAVAAMAHFMDGKGLDIYSIYHAAMMANKAASAAVTIPGTAVVGKEVLDEDQSQAAAFDCEVADPRL